MKAALETDAAVQDHSVPADEAERLVTLHRLGVLDTPPSAAFDGVARLAQAALQVPILCVSLVDQDRIWFKSRIGLGVRETARRGSFCDRVVWACEPISVRDAAADPRFADHSLVRGPQHIRSYLGIPLLTRDRQPMGTLCAMDTEVREFGEVEQVVLGEFAKIAEDLLSAKELAAKSDGVLQYAMEREKLFRDTFEQAPVGMVHTSLHGLILRINQRACAILGYMPAELRELSIPSITHPEDLPLNIREFKRTLAGELDSYRVEQRLLAKDQRYVQVALSVTIKRAPSRQPDYNIVVIEDLSAQKQLEAKAADASPATIEADAGAQAALNEARQVLEQRENSLAEAAAALERRENSLAEATTALEQREKALGEREKSLSETQAALMEREKQSSEARALLEQRDKALGEREKSLTDTQAALTEREKTLRETQAALAERDKSLAESQQAAREAQDALLQRQADLRGTQQTLRETQEALRAAQDQQREAQAALQAANARLAQESATDSLTVLPNRRTFSRRGEQAANALRQSRKPYGLILLDVDDFKRINEEHGHDVGDDVLRTLGNILSTQLRNSSDMAARLGGDEFAVLCFGDINEQTLHDVAERIHTQIGKAPLATPKGLLRFTGSFGLALSIMDDPDWKSVYGRADAALREAKHAGKDRISFGRSPLKNVTARLKALSAPSAS